MCDSLAGRMIECTRAAIAIGVLLGATPALAGHGAAAAPATAVNAEPHVLGVVGGIAHSAIEAEQDIEARGTLGLFARRGFEHRWALQLDLARVRHDERWNVYTSTVSAVHAFGWKPWLVPTVRVGVGLDQARSSQSSSIWGYHAEAAAGLELRIDGGFVLGAELGVGWRGPPGPVCLGEPPVRPDDRPGVEIGGCDAPLHPTTFRAAKLTLGVAF